MSGSVIFLPSPEYSGSGLASIFGASNAMDSGSSSLTYTAPKQPKKQAKGE